MLPKNQVEVGQQYIVVDQREVLHLAGQVAVILILCLPLLIFVNMLFESR